MQAPGPSAALMCLLLLAAASPACLQSELDPRCPAGDDPALALGSFGREALALDEFETIPVWTPIQGGLVAGLNVLATEVARDAERVTVRLSDPQTGKPLAVYQSEAATFQCKDEDLRLWDRVMVSFQGDATFDPSDWDGEEVDIEVLVWFPNLPGWPLTFVELQTDALLEDRLPDAHE